MCGFNKHTVYSIQVLYSYCARTVQQMEPIVAIHNNNITVQV